MRVVACMIVRDSGDQIVRCLDSARRYIDGVIVIDTGSTDDTPRRISEWADANGLPLALNFSEWVGFDANRTELMQQAAKRAEWLLLLDDDMVVHSTDPLPELTADCYMAWLRNGSLKYRLPFLVRASKPWRFKGAAHSYLACDEPITRENLDAFWVSHDGPGAGIDKILRDRDLLEAELERNPDDARTVFYLAQTYKDMGVWDRASELYLQRAEMNGSAEEAFYSLYMAGCLICKHRSFAEGGEILLRAWNLRRHRAEPLRALAHAAGGVADKLPLPDDSLFVHVAAYREGI